MSFFANITPFIIHPGDEGDIPGNTIEAVEHAATQWHALSSGVQGAIEADFRQLRDGTIIVCRYPHVEVDGKCYEWHEVDGEQIAKANAAQFLPPEKQDGRFFKIPTLQEFCAAVRTAKFKLIAEIKVDESASLGQKDFQTTSILTELRRSGFTPHNCLITSFDADVLAAVQDYPTPFKRGLMTTEPDLPRIIALSDEVGLSSIHIKQEVLSPELAHEILMEGLLIFPFVVNDISRKEALQSLQGVRSMLSDKASLLMLGHMNLERIVLPTHPVMKPSQFNS